MTETKSGTEYPPVVLHTRPALEMDEERFFEFCQLNKDWRIERSVEGDLEIMPPTGGVTGARNFKIASRLDAWAESDSSGVGFDSSTGFVLPNGAIRSPDASWVRRERLAGLTVGQKQRFLPLCPDFVIELRSPSDPLPPIQAKMREYVENGARLGWLIDPVSKQVGVYQPEEDVRILEHQRELSGDPVLRGFVLDLQPIWEPGF
jgi:Uma2 family endonuclease